MPPRDYDRGPFACLEDRVRAHNAAPEFLTRRRLLTAIPGLTLIAGGISCGGDDDDTVDAVSTDPTATSGASLPTAAATATRPTASAFPITLKHAFGQTEIKAEPKRIVTVGFTDHDMLLAIGVTPIALRNWYGDYPQGVWPWAQDKLGDAKPEVMKGALDFEAIAAMQPDLILGLYVGLKEDEYAKLSQIAPTVAQSGDFANFGTPWQEMTRMAGRATGRLDAAEKLIAGVDAHLAKVRKENPKFEGQKLVYAGVAQGGVVYVETDKSTRVAILESIGFVVPDEINALSTGSFYVELSQEKLSMLDHDLVFWELGASEGARSGIEANAVYRLLDVSKEGRHVFIDDQVMAGALAHADVLSIPYMIDRLVPRLLKAIDGDPATSSD